MVRFSEFFKDYFPELILLAVVWNVCFVLLRLYRRRNLPKINPGDIVYEETWQSGFSHRSIFGAGAKGCLCIKFLKDRIFIKPHFPFDLLGADWLGLEQEIKYTDIIECSMTRRFFVDYVLLKYNTPKGTESFSFTARNTQKVLSLCQKH